MSLATAMNSTVWKSTAKAWPRIELRGDGKAVHRQEAHGDGIARLCVAPQGDGIAKICTVTICNGPERRSSAQHGDG